MNKMAKGAGTLKDQVGDAQKVISVLASDTFKLDAALQGIQVGAAGFQIMQGAAAAFGSENKDLQKALVQLNGVMAITQGLQQIQNALQKESALSLGIQVAAQKAYNFVVGESEGVLKAFRIALAATGIGLAVIGIAALAANWDKLKEAIFGATESAVDYAKKQEKIQDVNKKTNDQLAVQIEYLKNIGKLTEESGQIKYNEKLSKDRAAAGKEYLKQVEALKEVQKAEKETFQVQSTKYERLDTYHKATQKQVDEQMKKVKEAYRVYIEAYNLEAKGEKDLQKIREDSTKKSEKKVSVLKEEKRVKEEILSLEKVASSIEVGSEEWYKTQIAQWEDIASKLKIGSEAYKAVRKEIDSLNEALDRMKNPLAELEKKPPVKTVADEIKERTERAKSIAEAEIQVAKETADTIFTIVNNRRNDEFNAQIQRLNDAKDKELENKNLTDNQKKRIEERYAREVAAIKTKQAQADKAAAITQAIINGALAITKLWVSPGFPAAIPLAITTAAQTAAQIAIISATKIPKFAKGTEFVNGAGTATSDSVPAMLSKGERVVPAHINKLLNGIPNEMLPEMLMPSKTMIGANMDYDKMAKAFSKELASNPQLMVNFDRRGFETFIKNGNTTQQVKNSRNDF